MLLLQERLLKQRVLNHRFLHRKLQGRLVQLLEPLKLLRHATPQKPLQGVDVHMVRLVALQLNK